MMSLNTIASPSRDQRMSCLMSVILEVNQAIRHADLSQTGMCRLMLEQSNRAVSGVAREPLRLKIKTPFNALDHSLGDGNLRHSVGACAFGVDDDPGFVVDEVVGVVSKQRVGTLPGNPCGLRI